MEIVLDRFLARHALWTLKESFDLANREIKIHLYRKRQK